MKPESIRALGALVAVHLSVRAAVASWAAEAVPEDRDEVERIGALVRLGVAPDQACRAVLGEASAGLAATLRRVEREGVSASAALEAAARRIEDAETGDRARSTSAAGALLSARIVLAFPAVWFVAKVLREGAAPAALAAAFVGLSLAAAGLAWISRLRPAAAAARVEDLALAVAHCSEAGAPVERALDDLARSEHDDLLAAPGELVRRGSSWPDALAAAPDPALARLGRLCAASRRYGVPLAPALVDFATRSREARLRELDRALKRAPVQMVVPLTTCVLPGCLLVAASPLLT